MTDQSEFVSPIGTPHRESMLRRRAERAEAEVERLRDEARRAVETRENANSVSVRVEGENNRLRELVERAAEDAASYQSQIREVDAEVERLREAVDTAYSALVRSQYVGGPTQREAWQAAMTALGAVATQHQSGAASDEQEGRP